MWIISRKKGRIWVVVLKAKDLEPHIETVKFMVQCGIDLKLSWSDING